MEKRLWLAMIISFLLIFLYQSWVVKKRMSPVHPQQEAPMTEVEKKSKVDAVPKQAEKQGGIKPLLLQDNTVQPKDVRIEHPFYTAIFTTENASLKSFKLKKYRTELDDNSPLVELVHNNGYRNPLSTIFESNFPLPEQIVYDVDRDFLNIDGNGTLTFSFEVKGGFRIEKEFRFLKDSYLIELNVRVINKQKKPLEEKFSILWNYTQEKNNSRYQQPGALILLNDSVKREILKEGQEKEFRGDIGWFGIDMHYFFSAIVPENKEGLWLNVKLQDMTYSVTGNYQPIVIPPEGSIEYKFRLFIGPKEISTLKSSGYKLAQAINLGWFHAIGYPLLILLKWLYGLIYNYGVAIIILTILVRVVFFPLSITSYRSMKKMQIIQPEMKELQKKYANDREKLSRETWELYRRHKVNPLGGCLPVLIQIPVFIALYQVLMNAIELRHAPFVLWMNDLSAPDLLFTIPLFGHPFPFRVLPVLMGLTMYVQQKMTPMAGDPQQVKIMMWMPVVLTVILYGLPSGLTLYWTVSNLLSIIQQWYINRKVKV